MPDEVVKEPGPDINALIEVVQTLVGKMDTIDAKLEALQTQCDHVTKVVDDEIIGGIQTLYHDQVRFDGISGLKKTYPDFAPYGDQFKKIAGKDIYEALYDVLEGLKTGEGYTDEMGDTHIKTILSEVQGALKLPEAKVEEVKVEEPPKEESKEPPKEEKEPESEIEKTIRQLKERKAPGMSRAVQGE